VTQSIANANGGADVHGLPAKAELVSTPWRLPSLSQSTEGIRRSDPYPPVADVIWTLTVFTSLACSLSRCSTPSHS